MNGALVLRCVFETRVVLYEESWEAGFERADANKLTYLGFSPFRHEIGHSLISVGEEYEGGYAYFGGASVSSSPRHSVR